jgi:hypothetical protein
MYDHIGLYSREVDPKSSLSISILFGDGSNGITLKKEEESKDAFIMICWNHINTIKNSV